MLTVQRETGVFLFTNEHLDGFEVEEYFGVVTGEAIYGANFLRDYLASIADNIGGRARGYEGALSSAMEKAMLVMAKRAQDLGANAIISMQMQTGTVNHRMLYASCCGTAIRFKRKGS